MVDLPGVPVHSAILSRTRLQLRSDGRLLGEEGHPEDDGTFFIERDGPPGPFTLRVLTYLQVDRFDRSLDRTVHVDLPGRSDVGEVRLPRSSEFGLIRYRIVDAEGNPLVPNWLSMDAVEGTSTPDIGIARLDEVNVSANAPSEYRQGASGTILHVPPGDYWLRATVVNRLMPAARVSVASGRDALVTLTEKSSALRVRGIVREPTGFPLEDVEITVSTTGHAGAGSRDPGRVLGKTSRNGAYDLPLPDPLPPKGLSLSFVRPGFRSSDLDIKAEHFKGGTTIVLDLDLGVR